MSVKVTDVVRPFDGSGDVEHWLQKAKLVAKLKKINELHEFLPLYLEGPAFSVYDQMPDDDKADAEKIERTLLDAFAQDTFAAYDSFRQRYWTPGEVVDVYLADLRRLARLADIESDKVIRSAFICGLPADVSAQIRSTVRISSTSVADIVKQTRILMSERRSGSMVAVGPTVAVAAAAAVTGGYKGRKRVTCSECGGDHPARYCKDRERKTSCWNCEKIGHLARNCPGNERGTSSALAVIPRE
jgi:hypothetical protein